MHYSVYNVKRKIASLSPITLDAYKSKIEVKEDVRASSSENEHDEVSNEGTEEVATPFQCLFCNQEFGEDDVGFDQNLYHMGSSHGLDIPDAEFVEDMQSLVGYLSTEVRVWHECVYCGATKPTTASIQSHMRDTNHCQLNLDREPELAEFWAPTSSSDEEETTSKRDLSDKEMILESGRVIASRRAGPRRKVHRKRNTMALTAPVSASPEKSESEPKATAEAQQSTGRQIARREQMGIIGISDQQRHALALAEKKAQRSEDVARRARDWVNNRGANLQKYDQIDTTGFKGKQNHKLMPR